MYNTTKSCDFILCVSMLQKYNTSYIYSITKNTIDYNILHTVAYISQS